MGVYCPSLRTSHPTVRPIPLYHGTGGTVHGNPLSHLRAPHPSVRPIPLYHGTGGTVYGSPLSESPISQCPSYPTVSWDRWDCPWESMSHLRAPYPSVRPIPLYHGTGGTVHGSPLSHLRDPSILSHCTTRSHLFHHTVG